MSEPLPPRRVGVIVSAALVLGALAGAWMWQSRRAAEAEALVRAQIAEEIERERDAQREAARLARERKAAEEAVERAAEQEVARADRAEREAALGDLRDVDKLLLLDWVGRDLGAGKRDDVTRGRPYRVDVYQEGGRTTATHAHVDLDRDGLWDEKWTFEPDGGVRRTVSPADDESYRVWEIWTGSRWKREGS
jgi:hypothetical protein